MLKFEKPVNLNGAQLLDELSTQNIELVSKDSYPYVDADGVLWLDIDDEDYLAAKKVVNAHNGKVESTDLTVPEKLKLVGLTVEDLRNALGI